MRLIAMLILAVSMAGCGAIQDSMNVKLVCKDSSMVDACTASKKELAACYPVAAIDQNGKELNAYGCQAPPPR